MRVCARVAGRTSVSVRPGVRCIAAHIVRVCARVAGVSRQVMGVRAVAGCGAGYAVRVARKVCCRERDGVRAASGIDCVCIASAHDKTVTQVGCAVGAVADHKAGRDRACGARPQKNSASGNCNDARQQGAIYSRELCRSIQLNNVVRAGADIERGSRAKTEVGAGRGRACQVRQVVRCNQVVCGDERRADINHSSACARAVAVYDCGIAIQNSDIATRPLSQNDTLARCIADDEGALRITGADGYGVRAGGRTTKDKDAILTIRQGAVRNREGMGRS